MFSLQAAQACLAAIPGSSTLEGVALARYTRFAIGGPVAVLFDATIEDAFVEGLRTALAHNVPFLVIGGGTNLVVADEGFKGIVLQFRSSAIERNGSTLCAGAGAVLQDVVDQSIALGLKGLETMTGIPGWLGGAVYGNAGAYGHSIQEFVTRVRVFDGSKILSLSNGDCQFSYRESIFKARKEWVILSADLQLEPGDPVELSRTAAEIRLLRDAKYPPSMKCAGSIFKNVLLPDLRPGLVSEIPPKVIREGKIPSAWFLEQVGAKGVRRGDIQVAEYHANLIYNDGQGTAADLVYVIDDLKKRVRERFGFDLQEEVQYVGFRQRPSA